MFGLIKKRTHEKWLIELIEKVIYHNPKTNVYMKSPKNLYEIIPQYKRLYCTDDKKGLPIGNLTSQFFSNIYLDEVDQFVKHKLKCRYYCRYVDDMLLLSPDSGYLNYAYSEISKFLENELALSLNHRKKNINLVNKGFDFVGYVIKPKRILLRQRTVKKAFQVIKKWKADPEKYSPEKLEELRNTFNSYLGMFRHINGYNYRKKLCSELNDIFVGVDEEYTRIFVN